MFFATRGVKRSRAWLNLDEAANRLNGNLDEVDFEMFDGRDAKNCDITVEDFFAAFNIDFIHNILPRIHHPVEGSNQDLIDFFKCIDTLLEKSFDGVDINGYLLQLADSHHTLSDIINNSGNEALAGLFVTELCDEMPGRDQITGLLLGAGATPGM